MRLEKPARGFTPFIAPYCLRGFSIQPNRFIDPFHWHQLDQNGAFHQGFHKVGPEPIVTNGIIGSDDSPDFNWVIFRFNILISMGV